MTCLPTLANKLHNLLPWRVFAPMTIFSKVWVPHKTWWVTKAKHLQGSQMELKCKGCTQSIMYLGIYQVFLGTTHGSILKWHMHKRSVFFQERKLHLDYVNKVFISFLASPKKPTFHECDLSTLCTSPKIYSLVWLSKSWNWNWTSKPLAFVLQSCG